MSTLSTSIVELGFATERDLEEALARQVMYGGELGSNLLELGVVTEEQLAQALSHGTGLTAAPVGELPRTPESLRGRLSAQSASHLTVHLLGEADGALLVAVAEPLPEHVAQELSVEVGAPLRQLAAPRVRIQQAVAREYGVRIPERASLVLRRLEGRPSAPPLTRGPSIDFKQMPRPQSVPPLALISGVPQSFDATTGPPPVDYEHLTQSELPPDAPTSPEPSEDAPLRAIPRVTSSRPQRRGPYTAAMAERDLLAAKSHDDVADAFFDFAAQYFEYAALFAVSGDDAVGRDARGAGSPAEKVRATRVPLDVPSVLSKVRDDRSWHLGRLRAGGVEGGLARDLDRPVGKKVLVLPIVVRSRAVLLLYGDHGAADVELAAVGDLISFAPLAASAIERVILERKRGQRSASLSGLALPASAPRKGQAPSREQKARALADLVGVEERASQPPLPMHHEPLTSEARPWGERHSSAPPFAAPSPTLPGFPILAADGAPAVAPAPHRHIVPVEPDAPEELASDEHRGPRALSEPPEAGWDTDVTFTPTESNTELGVGPRAVVRVGGSSTPFVSGAPRTITRRDYSPAPAQVAEDSFPEHPAAAREAPSPPGSSLEPGTPEGPLEPVEPSNSDESSAPSSPSSAEAPASESVAPQLTFSLPPSEAAAPEVTAADLISPIAAARASMRPIAPDLHRPQAPTFVASGATPAPRRATTRMAGHPMTGADALVDALCAGEEGALRELLALGEQAIAALVARFPGPVSVARRDATTRASDCGPVLHALSRLGQGAIPYLITRTSDEDATIREWATRLLGELPSREAAEAIARRLVDDVVDVRRAALAAARMMQSHPEARDGAQHQLEELATDRDLPASVRRAAIEALTDLRQKQATPRMIELLEDPDREVSSGARWSLMVLSRQDFGTDRAAWTQFWEESHEKHRIEWLIDSLTHPSRDIRRAAGDELKSVTREYFGYYDDLPEAERARAQTRYREWWETEGKRRFF